MNKLKHLAIILDGNRRYAVKKRLPKFKGHEFGAEKVESLLEWCKELNIKEVTLYILSIENLKREKKELSYLFSLFKRWFKKFEKDERIDENKFKIRFIGNLRLVPKGIRKLAKQLEEKTKTHNKHKLNFCFAYGGRLELIEAINKLKNKKGKITEKDISNSLWLSSEPDLIIRTGERKRTSNFLPWQSVYSEWLFLDRLWPEFTKQDLIKALKHFSLVQRNFGK